MKLKMNGFDIENPKTKILGILFCIAYDFISSLTPVIIFMAIIFWYLIPNNPALFGLALFVLILVTFFSIDFIVDNFNRLKSMSANDKEEFLTLCNKFQKIEAYRVSVAQGGRRFLAGDLVAAHDYLDQKSEDIKQLSKKSRNDELNLKLYKNH